MDGALCPVRLTWNSTADKHCLKVSAHLATASGTILTRLSASSSRTAHTGLLCSVAALPKTHSACTHANPK